MLNEIHKVQVGDLVRRNNNFTDEYRKDVALVTAKHPLFEGSVYISWVGGEEDYLMPLEHLEVVNENR